MIDDRDLLRFSRRDGRAISLRTESATFQERLRAGAVSLRTETIRRKSKLARCS